MNKKKIFSNFAFYTWFFLNFGTSVLASNTDVNQTLTKITNIILIIGAGVCIGKCIQIGIMYVMSSANEKSNAKMALIPWLIGTIVCFGAATIGKFVINLISGGNINKDVLEY